MSEIYKKELRIIKIKRLTTCFFTLSIPVVFFIVENSNFSKFVFEILCINIVVCVASAIITLSSKCPRCGKFYYGFFSNYNPYTKKCVSCALPMKENNKGNVSGTGTA